MGRFSIFLTARTTLFAVLCAAAPAFGASQASNSPGVFQGMGPNAIAITQDGQYAYLTLDLPPTVGKIRLSDFAVVATTDLSAFFPVEWSHIALDVTEKKLFAYSRAWRKLLVIDTDTMTLIHTLDDYPLIGMIRSRFGARLITWDGGNTVRFIDTVTFAVTTQATVDNLFIEKLEERGDVEAMWHLVGRTSPGGSGPLTAGVFDHVAKSWLTSVTFSTQQGSESVSAMTAVAADNRMYVGTFGGWYPTGFQGYGWLYSVDLSQGLVQTIAIDGGAFCLAARGDTHRLYIGTGWPVPNDKNLLVFDTQSETVLGRIPLGDSPYGWPHTQVNALLVDPANPTVLYATPGDSNSFMKVRLDTLSVERAEVYNREDVPAQWFARRPGHDSGYIILRNRANAIDFDSGRAVVNGVVTLPLIPAWSYGVAATSGGRLFMIQGDQVLEADETDLSHAVAHDLPVDVHGLYALRLSSDQKLLYSVAQRGSTGQASIFVAIDTATFGVEARLPLAETPHTWGPYEVPDQGKVYVLGGEPAGPVTIDVIETTNHTWQKRITFDEPGLLGISAGPSSPFAYDPESHTLFVGATYVVLAIDTQTDTIRQVIHLEDTARAVGLEPGQLTYINAVGLVYSPREHCLYMAHVDYSFVSVYDVAGSRFLPTLISLKGLFPDTMFANADVSKIYTLNSRSDSVTVIDTAKKTVERVLNLGDYVSVGAPGGPVVATQPASRTITAGTAVTFTSLGLGPRPGLPTPTVQWQVSSNGGASYTNIAGATSTSYLVTATAADNGKYYRAVFTNPGGTATTNAVVLTVWYTPTITTQPAAQTVTSGATATFSAAANGNPTPTLQWQVSTNGGTTWADITGATSTSYSWTPTTTADGTLYRAVFTNGSGTARSDAATLRVCGPAATSPTSLRFQATKAGADGALQHVTPAQSVTVAFAGAGSAWTATSSAAWLQISGGAGTGAGQFTASVSNPGNVIGAATSLTGTITVTPATTGLLPATVAVTVTIDQTNGTTAAAPFGQLDSPAQNAAGISGSIGVTGWALDDVGVSSVKLYRNCLAFEPAADCQTIGGTSVVYMGDADVVPEARPDVEAVYPTYPQANRAGWGYLLLTNMLPHIPRELMYGGQGSISIYVLATDVEGHQSWLGRSVFDQTPTTITMDNDAAAKPFGAIDTPGQGQTVSGGLWNFGWALTPDTNTSADAGDILVPTNGSTAVVWIDGAPAGNVTYNLCRGTVGSPPAAGVYCNDDVADIFGNPTPQATYTSRSANATRYRNLDAGRGAMGAYHIDTTTMSNGRHSIVWSVTDSNGRVDGIGSRDFIVLNASSDVVAASDVASVADRAGAAAPVAGLGSAVERHAANSRVQTVDGLDESGTEIATRQGFDRRAPLERLVPGDDGVRRVAIAALSRVELRLGAGVDAGYLVANGSRRDLPVGSRLDPRTGIFTWTPGPAYLGTYRLEFVQRNEAIVVDVTIGAHGLSLQRQN